MKAIVQDAYGPPEVLRLAEVEKPVVKDGAVLLRVHAAGVNPLDWHYMRGAAVPRAHGNGNEQAEGQGARRQHPRGGALAVRKPGADSGLVQLGLLAHSHFA